MSDESTAVTCDDCRKRTGDVVIDEIAGPFYTLAGKKIDPFRFVYRRCRWCKGVETKRRNDFMRRHGA